MSEETVVAAQTEAQAETTETVQAQPVAPGEKAERVYTKAEVEEFVRARLANAQTKADEAAKKAAVDAEAKALAQQGEFKTLYEKTVAELEAERNRAKALEVAALKRDAAKAAGLPETWANRLQGETLEALTEDAQIMFRDMPKPAAPNINAASGSGQSSARLPAGMTEDGIRAQAVRLGVNPDEYMKQFLRSN